MDETRSPSQRIRGPDGYNRLTTVETAESQSTTTTPTATASATAAPEAASVMQDFLDSLKQMSSACPFLTVDCVMTLAFIILVCFGVFLMSTFAPVGDFKGLADRTDGGLQHVFYLNSLVISEIQASPAQLTGNCHVSMIAGNLADQTLHQDNAVLSVFIHHELLWVMRTGNFSVEGRKTMMFNVNMNAATTVSIPASFVPTAVSESQKSGRPLYFKVKYDGMLREGLEEGRLHVYAVCGWIKMQFVDETTLKGGPTSCHIEEY